MKIYGMMTIADGAYRMCIVEDLGKDWGCTALYVDENGEIERDEDGAPTGEMFTWDYVRDNFTPENPTELEFLAEATANNEVVANVLLKHQWTFEAQKASQNYLEHYGMYLQKAIDIGMSKDAAEILYRHYKENRKCFTDVWQQQWNHFVNRRCGA